MRKLLLFSAFALVNLLNASANLRSARVMESGGCQPTASSLTATACVSYTTPSGSVLTASGVYSDTIMNAGGCDSVITISLTIDTVTTSMLYADACHSFTLPSGVVLTVTGLYPYDTLRNAAGCDSVIVMVDLQVMTVDTSITVSGNTITANAWDGVFQWVDCSNGYAPVQGATDSSFTPTASGTYAAVIMQGLCRDTSACVTITVGIDDQRFAGISVYPNPVADVLTIENCPAGARIVLTDAQGRMVQTTTATGNRVQLDLSAAASGLYFVQVVSGDRSAQMKITKL